MGSGLNREEQTSQLCKASISAVNKSIASLFPASKQIVIGDGAPHINTLNNATGAYENNVASAMSATVKSANPGYQKALTDFATVAKQKGWIHAGSWFWTIAGMQEISADSINEAPLYTGPNLNAMGGSALYDYNTTLKSIDEFDTLAAEKVR